MTAIKGLYTVADAAEELGVSERRVRQLCQEHELGEFVGRSRVLSDKDMRKLKSLPRTIGRPPEKP